MVSNCRLQFTPNTGAEVNAIGLRQLHLLGLSEGDLSACHDEVSAAGRSLLRSAGTFQATLSLGSTVVDTTMSVFHDIDDCLLSWYDARALRIIPDTYPKQISSLQRSKDSTSEDCRIEEAL